MEDGCVDVCLGVVRKQEGERRQKMDVFSPVNTANGTLCTFVLVLSSPFHLCFVDLGNSKLRPSGPFPDFWDNRQQC